MIELGKVGICGVCREQKRITHVSRKWGVCQDCIEDFGKCQCGLCSKTLSYNSYEEHLNQHEHKDLAMHFAKGKNYRCRICEGELSPPYDMWSCYDHFRTKHIKLDLTKYISSLAKAERNLRYDV